MNSLRLPEVLDSRWNVAYLAESDQALVDLANSCLRDKADLPFTRRVLALLSAWHLPASAILTALAYFLILFRQLSLCKNTTFFDDEIVKAARHVELLDQPPCAVGARGDAKRFAYAERLRRLFVTCFVNIDVVLVCSAFHIVRMYTLEDRKEDEILLLAEASRDIYVPLLGMLGMWQVQRELGDISLHLGEPSTWEEIRFEQDMARSEVEDALREMLAELESVLQDEDGRINAAIQPHFSSPHSVNRQLRLGELCSDVVRQLQVDIIVATETECDRVRRALSARWQFVKDLDLLSTPRFNGSRGLLITVHLATPSFYTNVEVRFRVRTQQMEWINNYGLVAARYLRPTNARTRHGVWWDDQDLLEFVRTHEVGKDTDTIFVFSPLGQVYRLTRGCTAVDFAFSIHSETGIHSKRFIVNGRPTQYHTPLNNGDLVEVEIDPSYTGPLDLWRKVVKSTTARRSITRALRAKDPKAPNRGRKLFDNVLSAELHLHGLQKLPDEIKEEYVNRVAQRLGYANADALFLDMGTSTHTAAKRPVSPHRLVARLIAEQLVDHVARADGGPLGVAPQHIRFVQCQHGDRACRIVPGQPIIGRLRARASGQPRLSVYRVGCPNAPTADAGIPLVWRSSSGSANGFRLILLAVDRPYLLNQILQAVYACYNAGVYIRQVEAQVDVDHEARVELTLTFAGSMIPDELQEQLQCLYETGIVYSSELQALSPVEQALLPGSNLIPNPYKTSAVDDARVFKGREVEIERLMGALNSAREVIVVYGAGRVGKTSLLRYTQKHVMPLRGFVPVIIAMGQHLAEFTEMTFWSAVLEGVTSSAEQVVDLPRRARRATLGQLATDDMSGLLRAFRDAATRIAPHRIVIMLDDFSTIEHVLAPTTGQRLVRQIQTLSEACPNVSFILAVHDPTYTGAHETYRMANPLVRSAIPLRLGHLSVPAAEQLVREPMGDLLNFEPEAVSELLRLTACHPYYLQLMLYHLVQNLAPAGRKLVTLELVRRTAQTLIQYGQLIFSDFESYYDRTIHMRRIVEVVAHRSMKENWPDLTDLLTTDCIGVREHEIQDILNYLCRMGVLEHGQDAAYPAYRVRIPLYGLWLSDSTLQV